MSYTNVICTTQEQIESLMDFYQEDISEDFENNYEHWLEDPTPCVVTYGDDELDFYSKSTMLALVRALRELWPEQQRITFAEWENCHTWVVH